MEQKLTKEAMAKLMAAKSAAELMVITKEIGAELSEKDANRLFELLRDHEGEISEDDLRMKFESLLEKKRILGQKLDDDELDAISGGDAAGNGGCSADYYYDNCNATVETGSSCWGVDWCSYIYSCPAIKYGGCSSSVFVEKCTSTVAENYICGSNDICISDESIYTVRF